MESCKTKLSIFTAGCGKIILVPARSSKHNITSIEAVATATTITITNRYRVAIGIIKLVKSIKSYIRRCTRTIRLKAIKDGQHN